MLAIQLQPELSEKLVALAKKTGKTTTSCAHEAIKAYLEDLEDYQLAVDASTELAASSGKTFTSEEAKRELGL